MLSDIVKYCWQVWNKSWWCKKNNPKLGNKTLTVKLETTLKPAKPPTNHPNYQKTKQTTHKPPTNQPNHPQTNQIPSKSPTNHPKSHHFFTEDIFYEPQHFPWPSHARRVVGGFFYVSARFRISPFPLNSSLPSLIADYNPIHKLLTQLQTLMNFLRRLELTMLHWRFYEY